MKIEIFVYFQSRLRETLDLKTIFYYNLSDQ